jgi:hypothetical protein
MWISGGVERGETATGWVSLHTFVAFHDDPNGRADASVDELQREQLGRHDERVVKCCQIWLINGWMVDE